MKDWKTLKDALLYAKTKKEERKAYFAILMYLEKASTPQLKKIIGTTKSKDVTKQASLELWWRKFNKEPENLLKLIKTSNNKEKIGRAIEKLGEIKYKDATKILIRFLSNIDLRGYAALALRKMPTQETFEPLVRAIKQHPDEIECLLYALQVIDCSDAAELLVELFISKPAASVIRDDIFVCFAKGAVKIIPKKVKGKCCKKVLRAIEKSKDKSNTEELEQFYEVLAQVEEV